MSAGAIPASSGGSSGTAPTGQPGDPIILAPVKWAWVSGYLDDVTLMPAHTYAAGPGSLGVGATITANANGAIQYASMYVDPVNIAKMLGSDASVAAGALVGDRVFFMDAWVDDKYEGIYTITSLGSAGTPWVLTRATDLDTEAKAAGALRVSVAGTGLVCELFADEGAVVLIPRVDGTGPQSKWTARNHYEGYSTALGNSASALGLQATARGDGATAVGKGSFANGLNASAFGSGANASASGATAIGTTTLANASGATAVGHRAEAGAAFATASGAYVASTVAGVHVVGSHPSSVPAIGSGGAAILQGIETTQTASFAVVLQHMGRFIPCNHATVGITATIPLNATVAFPIGAMIEFGCQGAADVTVAGAGGVTLLGTLVATTPGQVLKARKIDTDTWWVSLTS